MNELRVFGLLLIGSLALAATPQDGVQSLARTVDAFPPSIDFVTPTCSFAPGVVAITGENLDWVVDATVAGEPARILSQSPNTLTLKPAPADPGFDTVVLNGVLTSAESQIELFPSLRAELAATPMLKLTVPGTDGLGQVAGVPKFEVTIRDSENSFFVLAASAGASTRSLTFVDPSAYYQVMLDRDFVVLDWGFLMRPVYGTTLTYDVPHAFTGHLYLQGLCAQLGSGTTCYTNLGHVVIE